MKPYYSDESVTLYHGDCAEVLPTLGEVDLIVTDPPYFRVKTEAWDRAWKDAGAFLDWLGGVADLWRDRLAANGSLYCFASPRMSARVEVMLGERFGVLNRVTWAKPDPRCELNTGAARSGQANIESIRQWWPRTESIIFAEHHGSDGMARGESGWAHKCDELRGFVFEPLRAYLAGERDRAGWTTRRVAEEYQKKSGSRTVTGMAGHWFERVQWALPTSENYEWLRSLFNSHQPGEYLRRDYEELRRDYEELRRDYEELRRPFTVTAEVPYTDVWTFPTVAHYPGKHPCEKPAAMLEHMIRASSRSGATVLDSFAGTGSTLLAARALGRKAIGIEQSERYCEQAAQRLSERTLPLGVSA